MCISDISSHLHASLGCAHYLRNDCSDYNCCLGPSSLGLVPFDGTSLGSLDHALQPLLGSSLLASSPVQHLPVQRPVCIGLYLAGTLCVTLGALSSFEPAYMTFLFCQGCTQQYVSGGETIAKIQGSTVHNCMTRVHLVKHMPATVCRCSSSCKDSSQQF